MMDRERTASTYPPYVPAPPPPPPPPRRRSGPSGVVLAVVVLVVLLALVVTGLAALRDDPSSAASAPATSSHSPSPSASPARPTSSPSPTPPAPDGFERYENVAVGYALEYPESWRFFEGRNGRVVNFQHGMTGFLTVMVTRTVVEDPGVLMEMSWKGIKATTTDLHEIDRTEHLTVAGLPAASVEFTGRVPQFGRVRFQILQVVVVDGRRAFVFTYVAKPKDFDGQRAEAETVMASLQPGV